MLQCICSLQDTAMFYIIDSEVMFMKKRLVAYLLVSVLAVAVFAGCSKKDKGDGADAAATGDAAVVEEAADDAVEEAADAVEEATDAVDTAAEAAVEDAADAATISADDAAAIADDGAADEDAVTEFVDDEEKAEGEDAEAAKDEETPAEGDYLVVDPGTEYIVRYGGYVYSSPEEIDTNIIYVANPGDHLNIVERLDNFWYKVTYYIAGEGIEHTGYIQIQ